MSIFHLLIPTRLTPVGRRLRDARKAIEKKNWSQGRTDGVRTGGPCAAAAITYHAGRRGRKKANYATPDEAMRAFADHNSLPYPKPDYSPTQRTTAWNDTLGRTREEVLAAFRNAEAWERRPMWGRYA